ncbi:gamma-glutamyltranspeptidase 1 [Tanacetum coccineum]
MRIRQESGAGDAEYVQRAMIHYEIDTRLPFKLCHCWEILKDCPKWKEIAIPNFNTESEGGSKRHKSSGSSSFNTEYGEASINLNTTVSDKDEDEMQEIRRPEGRDKARAAGRKNKGTRSAGSSNVNKDALARREMKCREGELEQQDMRFYLQPYDHLTGDQRKAMDEIRAKIKAKYNLQY